MSIIQCKYITEDFYKDIPCLNIVKHGEDFCNDHLIPKLQKENEELKYQLKCDDENGFTIERNGKVYSVSEFTFIIDHDYRIKLEKLQKENEILRLVVEKLKNSNDMVLKRMGSLHDRINCQHSLDDSQKKGIVVTQSFWTCFDLEEAQKEVEELLKQTDS